LWLLRKVGGLQTPYPFSGKSEFSIFRNEIMVKSRYSEFYNYLGKFREPPVEGNESDKKMILGLKEHYLEKMQSNKNIGLRLNNKRFNKWN
jgi:hypothetical protein